MMFRCHDVPKIMLFIKHVARPRPQEHPRRAGAASDAGGLPRAGFGPFGGLPPLSVRQRLETILWRCV